LTECTNVSGMASLLVGNWKRYLHNSAARWRHPALPVVIKFALVSVAICVFGTGLADDEESADTGVTPREAAAAKLHAELLISDRFPPATKCAACHPKHYREWSVSPHAYAQLSPVFNAMHGTILKRTNGTQGDFCIRCHTPVGMNLGEPLFMSNMDRHPTSREGVTCIVCHRVDKDYGRISGRLAMVEGDIFDHVFGPSGDAELKKCLEDKTKCRVNEERGKRGRAIHSDVTEFPQLTEPEFCGTCHDVRLRNGFRLEDAFSEYNYSPAALNGITCNDCHMGKEPGVVSGYENGPAAVIGGGRGKPYESGARKLTSHLFPGPDYSVIHPGLFPHNTDAEKLASMRQWLEFEWRDPVTKNEEWWGTDDFEDKVRANKGDYEFPKQWRSRTRRVRARKVIREQLALLSEIEEKRLQVLQAGYKLGEIIPLTVRSNRLRFKVKVRNGTDGHGVPTGFDAERLVWLRVTVTDAAGEVIFRSGDLDPNGDLRDLHSLYVHNGELPLDRYLFSLQSRFLTRNIRGGEREQVIPINVSPDPLPFLRPETRSSGIFGRPRGARKQKENIPPNGHRWARYEISGNRLTGNGPYLATVELVSGMIPINLLNDIQEVGFDYGMSAKQIGDAVVEGHQVLWRKEHRFEIDRRQATRAAETGD
jgi:hypothetical protein